jgi:serine/threonine protein kinase
MGCCHTKEEARATQARLAAQKSARQLSTAAAGGGSAGGSGGAGGAAAAAVSRRTVPESLFAERYKLGAKVGAGTFAEVFRCVDRRTGAVRAVKVIPKHMQKGRFLSSFHREMDILEVVNHPYVIRLLEALETTDKIYLVTDFLEGGDLLQQLMASGRLTEVEARCVIQKVLWAVDYLHHAGVLHRDLKPENILLGANGLLDLKLCDFGHSAFGENKADGFGTYDYLAPEVILSEPATAASDMWSVGVLCYVILSGTFAFCANDEQQMYKEIIAGEYSFAGSQWDGVSAEAKDFVSKLMNVDKGARLTAGTALRHPWIVDHNDDDLWEATGSARDTARSGAGGAGGAGDDGGAGDGDPVWRGDRGGDGGSGNGRSSPRRGGGGRRSSSGESQSWGDRASESGWSSPSRYDDDEGSYSDLGPGMPRDDPDGYY